MRTQTIFAWALVVCGGALSACGGSEKKPAEDPSSTSSASDEPPPKWDTSSESADEARHPEFHQDDPSGPPPAPKEAPQQERRMDQYDKQETETVLKRAALQAKNNCGAAKDENGKATGPWGKVEVSIVLGHNGHSKDATVPEPFADKPVGRCVVQAFRNLTFPPWYGSDTTVSWQVELVQPK